MYYVNIFKLLTRMEDSVFQIKKAEKLRGLWISALFLLLFTIIIYGWMGYLGIGSNIVSKGAVQLDPTSYNTHKLWFFIGRIFFGIFFWAFILFVPALFLSWISEISLQKMIILQQLVLALLLVERLIWIPLAAFAGLDWYGSPLSLGIIAAYITSKSWIIYFFGAISVFQIFVVYLQVRYISGFTNISTRNLWISVAFLHFMEWCFVSLFASMDTFMIGGWFG